MNIWQVSIFCPSSELFILRGSNSKYLNVWELTAACVKVVGDYSPEREREREQDFLMSKTSSKQSSSHLWCFVRLLTAISNRRVSINKFGFASSRVRISHFKVEC